VTDERSDPNVGAGNVRLIVTLWTAFARTSVVVPTSANRSSQRSEYGETEPDDEQDGADDDQEVDAGDQESNDEQNDAERDQFVSPDGVMLRAASLLDP
jgi:hypothetical protein